MLQAVLYKQVSGNDAYGLQGDIEKTDELLMSDEPDKPEPRKRKVKPKQGKAGSPVKTPGKAGVLAADCYTTVAS